MELYEVTKRSDGKFELRSLEGEIGRTIGYVETKEAAFQDCRNELENTRRFHQKGLEHIKKDTENLDVLIRRELSE